LPEWYWQKLQYYYRYNKHSLIKQENLIISENLLSQIKNLEKSKELRDDMLVFSVFYNQIAFTYVYESPDLNLSSLLSNFGGSFYLILV